MKAVVYHGIGAIRLDRVWEPKIQNDFDALVRVTASAIGGTDLHFVRSAVSGMQEGTVLGHEKKHSQAVEMIRSDIIGPSSVPTNLSPLPSAIDAYKLFDRREAGCVKVELVPAA